MGSALMGSMQMSCLLTPVNLLVSSQKCQGVPFPNLSRFVTFAAAPLVLTPFVRIQMKTVIRGRHDEQVWGERFDEEQLGNNHARRACRTYLPHCLPLRVYYEVVIGLSGGAEEMPRLPVPARIAPA